MLEDMTSLGGSYPSDPPGPGASSTNGGGEGRPRPPARGQDPWTPRARAHGRNGEGT